MDTQTILELVGYGSSLLVLVSLLMTSVVKFRIINAVGSLVFTVYAVLIHSYPTAVLNACLVLIDVWFLIKVLRRKAMFSLVKARGDDASVAHFLEFYREDIRAYFPDFDFAVAPDAAVYFVYADANPAGLLIAGKLPDEALRVALDYSCPAYRDCSVGKFLYSALAEAGVRRLDAGTHVESHAQYLKAMGFVERDGRYQKEL